MRRAGFRGRAARGALLSCLSLALLLSGCAGLRHHPDVGCRRPTFSGNTENLAPLRVPPGLMAPDRTNAIKIPALNVPQQPRPATAPCLDWPPQYVNEPLLPPTRRPTQ